MPIVDPENNVPSDTIPTVPEDRKLYTNPELKTSTLFDEDHSLDEIIRYIDGNKWTVDFFQQIREINTPAILPDINVPATTLSYNRINKLVIYLSGTINQSNVNDITGSATINAGFVPNYGDVIMAKLTGGRKALLIIDSIEKNTYNLHNIYEVTFKLHSFLDKNSEFYRDLISKVMKEYTYDENFIQDKSSPIILSTDYVKKLNFKNIRTDLINYYFNTMINNEKNVILLPTLNSYYLDTVLTDFIYKTIGYTGYEKCSKLVRHEVTINNGYDVLSFILDQNINKLPLVKRNLGFKFLPTMYDDPVTRHIGWMGIDYIVDEVNENTLIDLTDVLKPTDIPLPLDFVRPIEYPGNDYIFSEQFYTNDIQNMGIMEKLVMQYVKHEALDQNLLTTVCEQYSYWNNKDKYYLIPILILLLDYNIKNTYSSI